MGKARDRVGFFLRLLTVNGIVWTTLFIIYWIWFKGLQCLAMALRSLERRCLLTGLPYSPTEYDYRNDGEHYTDSAEWKECIINSLISRYIKAESTILEIGCGAGKWSQHLRPLASTLILTDVYDKSIEHVRERFGLYDNVRFYVNVPGSLADIPDSSIDVIWSFDVFVVVSPKCASDYAKEFKRVLKDGGVGVVNLMNDTPRLLILDGYSSLTGTAMERILSRCDLKIVDVEETCRSSERLSFRKNTVTIVFKKN